jgi:hypothetical protein
MLQMRVAMTLLATAAACANAADVSRIVLSPQTMPRVATVDERFQSYNVEMLEVTGGRFWKPYEGTNGKTRATSQRQSKESADTPAGMDPSLYEYRSPIDLSNPRLRKLAVALGPAYVRVSGTWANSTFFPLTDEVPAQPPAGFGSVLSHQQWKGVVDFSRAVNAKIVTSMATSAGVRDSSGVWTPDQARRFLAYTRSIGGSIAASEFMNEPTLAAMGGAPPGYDAAAYGRDFKVFRAFAKEVAPEMIVLGPGSVGETSAHEETLGYGSMPFIATRKLLAASGQGVDAFSYHHYGAASIRCAGTKGMPQTTADAALSEAWLASTEQTRSFYRRLRDEFEPGKPLWLTETADAACGGNPWASTFLDTFRYLDQLGRLAKAGVQEVMHNTLAASDYGLLDQKTLAPRPNYWGALLWRSLMGSTVLDAGVPLEKGQHLYAHCLRGTASGVALLLINNDKRARAVNVPLAGESYTLSASKAESQTVQLNGRELKLARGYDVPTLAPVATRAGSISVAPETITFLALPTANNAACRMAGSG